MATTFPSSRPANLDIGPALRGTMAAGGIGLGSLVVVAMTRAAVGLAPAAPQVREVAVMIHLAAVLPAIPLGLYVLATRKGGARHRLLGRVWMALMLVTALSALFIRHMNQGHFSPIHLFVPATLYVMWKAIASARAGRIGDHRRHLVGLFLGALLVPGLFSFLPERLMGVWLLG